MIILNNMEGETRKNIWGRKEGAQPGWGNNEVSCVTTNLPGTSSLKSGPFGSAAFSGPSSMPTMQKEKSKLFSFEIGSSSSGSSAAGSGPSSLLAFGMVAKKYNYIPTPGSRSDENKMDIASGCSSKNSSTTGSWSRLEWSGVVEGVFREEIGKMVGENCKKQANYWRS